MRNEWELEELIACWTLDEGDWRLLANKTGATRLGFALLLKFFDLEGRFPADRSELPAAVVEYVAKLVMVPAGELAGYAWQGRTIEYHRAQIRSERGFREASGEDERRMVEWLAGELCPVELSPDRLRDDPAIAAWVKVRPVAPTEHLLLSLPRTGQQPRALGTRDIARIVARYGQAAGCPKTIAPQTCCATPSARTSLTPAPTPPSSASSSAMPTCARPRSIRTSTPARLEQAIAERTRQRQGARRAAPRDSPGLPTAPIS